MPPRNRGLSMDNAEISDLQVFGPTSIGWYAATPPNEVVDEFGEPLREEGFGEPDPRVPERRVPDDPQVEALREHLRANNGIRGLEICAPDEVDRAARIYRRDGIVVVADALDAEHLGLFREGCARGLKEVLSHPGWPQVPGRDRTASASLCQASARRLALRRGHHAPAYQRAAGGVRARCVRQGRSHQCPNRPAFGGNGGAYSIATSTAATDSVVACRGA